MAEGVHDTFPLAMFVHAKSFSDLRPEHLEGQVTILLVDAVVNTGASVMEFVQGIRKLHPTARIVIVTGVMLRTHEYDDDDGFEYEVRREEKSGDLQPALEGYSNVFCVALRFSCRKFKGKGGTDTGNRLFNMTHID